MVQMLLCFDYSNSAHELEEADTGPLSITENKLYKERKDHHGNNAESEVRKLQCSYTCTLLL